MLYIRENLETREKAEAYNKKIYDYRANATGHPGCIGGLACIHCYHVISDSICLCSGHFICPQCNKQNGLPLTFTKVDNPPLNGKFFWIPEIPYNEDYSI